MRAVSNFDQEPSTTVDGRVELVTSMKAGGRLSEASTRVHQNQSAMSVAASSNLRAKDTPALRERSAAGEFETTLRTASMSAACLLNSGGLPADRLD